ncbi:MAG TPA: hypothetical protein VEL47_03320, partial [Myxococcota bacterium]|nr:hypothetical protein [Myxococcota bacterium]
FFSIHTYWSNGALSVHLPIPFLTENDIAARQRHLIVFLKWYVSGDSRAIKVDYPANKGRITL